MPPRPRAPRSRAPGPRRPRVAGLNPAPPRPAPSTPSRTDEPTPVDRAAGATTTVEVAEDTAILPVVRVDDHDDRDDRTDDETDREGADRAAVEDDDRADADGRTDAADDDYADDDHADDGRATDRQAVEDPADDDRAADDTADRKAPEGAGSDPRRSRSWTVPLLVGALVVLIAFAVVAGIQDAGLRGTPSARNDALVDVGATAEAAGQLSDAVETVYSFDFARLDENEKAARAVITPEFGAQFDRLFADVRARAPQQQAVVSATVTMSGVKELSADRAVLVAFVDQHATRAAAGADGQEMAAAGRLAITGERVDGRWKIAAVTPL